MKYIVSKELYDYLNECASKLLISNDIQNPLEEELSHLIGHLEIEEVKHASN
jgi:hypothetical protein